MRWWLRIILTLVLAPILWRLVAGYIAVNAGGSAMDIARGSAVVLGEIYVAYTLPALAIIILLLVPADIVLRRIGVAILIVGVAPLLACLVPLVLARYGIGQDNGGMLGLAFAYGLVWGLTIREPRQTRGAAMAADASR
jgi:hypothetical protein